MDRDMPPLNWWDEGSWFVSIGLLSEASATKRLDLVHKPWDVVSNPFLSQFLKNSNLWLSSDVLGQIIPVGWATDDETFLGQTKVSIGDEYSSCTSVISQLCSQILRFIVLSNLENCYECVVDNRLVDHSTLSYMTDLLVLCVVESGSQFGQPYFEELVKL